MVGIYLELCFKSVLFCRLQSFVVGVYKVKEGWTVIGHYHLYHMCYLKLKNTFNMQNVTLLQSTPL